ncbi:MAG: respiratory nitrate reductase subunit gamma [Anaerolineae bacterium]
MDGLSLTFNALAYLAVLIFWMGLGLRLWLWLETPVPFRIPTTPAPKTRSGAWARVAGEVVAFRSLYRADRALWLGSWLFHLTFLLLAIRHLRYFLYPVPGWVVALAPIAGLLGLLFVLPGVYLFLRRLLIDRVRYGSLLSDYLVLLLLLAIGTLGLLIKYVAPVDLVEVKAFLLGLITLSPTTIPAHPLFLIHFTLVLILVAYFPFSKLLHAPGVFLSPTRNQPNDGRRRLHVNPWDPPDPLQIADRRLQISHSAIRNSQSEI